MTRKKATAEARRLYARDGRAYAVLHCGCNEYDDCNEYYVKARSLLDDCDWQDAVEIIEQQPAPLPTFPAQE